MSELITTTKHDRALAVDSPFLMLDPLDLIARSSRAERTKAEYTKALRPFLDAGGNLLDVEALVSYADGLCGSRRACLRAAVKIWIDKTQSIIKATANPARATPQRMAEIQALFMKMESIPEMIETPKAKGSKTHTWLSTRQVKALAATCDKSTIDGLRDAVVLGLLVGAGLRRQELAALTWDKVKFQPCGDKMRTVLEITGKGDKTRTVPISDGLAALLDTWAETTGKEGYVVRALGRSLDLGDSLSASAIFNIVEKHGRQIRIEALRPHDLRRTFAQIGYASGVPITQISTLLGHASVQTTQRYLNLDVDLSTTASDFVPFA